MKKTTLLLLSATAFIFSNAAIAEESKPEDKPQLETSGKIIKREIDFETMSKKINGDRDWNEVKEGSVGVSMFSFEDRNGNGKYDLGDKPLANIPVILLDDKGEVLAIKKTNIDGYVNFLGQSTGDKVEIIQGPGKFFLRLLTPDKFELTTNNLMQPFEVVELKGSIGGIVATKVPSISGFKRKLEITGNADTNEIITLTPEGGSEQKIDITSEGKFASPLQNGTWTIKKGDKSETLEIKDLPIQLSKTFFDAPVNDPENKTPITTVTFDDMLTNNGVVKIPSGYSGLDWDNWVITHDAFYTGEGYRNGSTSGNYVVYNSSGHPAAISRDKPFDFVGGNFSVSFDDGEGEGYEIKGYRNGELVYNDVVKLSRFIPNNFLANYKNIDRLEFNTQHRWQGIGDDLQFRLHD